ncbi:hypothetical protein Pfo_018994 [Paulownia fortunei]|nr:hypothetical protein Pfo_018994 [Paulownia fortunei]
MALSHPLKGKTLLSRMKPFLALERFKSSFVEDGGHAQFSSNTGACSGSGQVEFSKWRKVDSRNLGIARSMISIPSWIVLKNLRAAGFEAYLVGGCVRDLLLNKVPKDFDVITTARLKQVKKKFQHAIIVGQRFPICRVIVKGSLVEVSSFETVPEESRRKQVNISQMPTGCDPRDFVRWKNCMNRDFTVNSLFFDPFVNVIFDYANAMTDLKSLKLRTVIPAHLSFKEDEARILRGLRLAARLNLSFSKETEAAIYSLSSSVADLSKSRISLEMNYMLSYGAAEPSLLLLKRFKLLEILLPFHAAYLCEQVDNRLGQRPLMLMKLFFNLDQLITCDQPCNDSLWVAILAFHLTLFSNPQHAVVVLTFASLLYHRTWEESIKFARQSALATRIYVPEILDAFDYLSDDEIAERVTQFAGQVENSVNVLINKDCLFEAMTRFPEFPCSGLVFVSQKRGKRVNHVFNILAKDVTSLKSDKRSLDIDYRLLKVGNVGEIRFVLGKIILDTLVYGTTAERGVTKAKKDNIQVMNPPPKLEILEQIRHTSMHLRKLDSIVKDENKRSISPSNNERLPDSASKTRLFEDNHIVTDDILSGKLGSESSDLYSHSSVPDKILKDEHVKAEIHSNASLLSNLFK